MWAYTVPNQYTPSFRERALKVMTSLPFPLIRLVAHSHSTLLAIPLHKFIVLLSQSQHLLECVRMRWREGIRLKF